MYFYSFKVNLLAFKAMRLVLQKSLQEVFNKYCILKYIALIFSEQQRLHSYNFRKYPLKCHVCKGNCGCCIKPFLRENQHLNLRDLCRSRILTVFTKVNEIFYREVKKNCFFFT